MSKPVIRVENLGKRYLLGQQKTGQRYRALRDDLMDAAKAPWRWARRGFVGNGSPDQKEEFWALRDVSFEVGQGDVVGIIGRNGAGKSTLLKLLSRITEPTCGHIALKGRIASLLEVGTGFHPELTGRENIYLNGAILGMSRVEIKARFDEIVAFAEVEKFLDTPVKRYSSGMYVRLAFAVAAHLEPEILIVDEVLAVGDAEFQKKCLGKMGDVASREGRTVLFVSHNMGAINLLCSRAILMRKGILVSDGPTNEVVRRYFDTGSTLTTWQRTGPVEQEEGIYILRARILVDGQVAASQFGTDQEFTVEVVVQAQADYSDAEIAVRITNHEGVPVLTTANSDQFNTFQLIGVGQHTLRVHVPAYLLSAGTYSFLISALIPGKILFDILDGDIQITVDELGPQASTTRDGRLGVVNPRLTWEHDVQSNTLLAFSRPTSAL